MSKIKNHHLKAEIVSKREVAQDTFELSLHVKESFSFVPGQYIWLIIPELAHPDPRGNHRAFSIVSLPSDSEVKVAFRKYGEGGKQSGFKQTLLELAKGSEVYIAGPYGSSFNILQKDKQPSVIVAGGIGISPFMNVLQVAAQKKLDQRFIVLYANDTREKAAYLTEMEEMAAQVDTFSLKFTRERPKRSDFEEIIPADIQREHIRYYISGPQGFIDASTHLLESHGVLRSQMAFQETYPSDTGLALKRLFLDEKQLGEYKLSFKDRFFSAVLKYTPAVLLGSAVGFVVLGLFFGLVLEVSPQLLSSLPFIFIFLWLVLAITRLQVARLQSQSSTSPFVGGDFYLRSRIYNLVSTILETFSNHVVVSDLNGVVLYANQGAVETTGFSRSEIIGRTPRLWGGLMNAQFYQKMWKIKKTAQPFVGEFRNRRKNGDEYVAIARISTIKDDNGDILGYIATEEDITDRAQSEQEVFAANNELSKLNQLMMAREVKMAELKQKNTQLEEQLQGLMNQA